MKKFKLFSTLVILLIATYSFAQWSFVGGVTGAGTYPSISVSSPTLVFVSGGNNTAGTPAIFKSTNGGTSFTQIGVTGITYDLMCIWAIDANNIFVGDGGAAGGVGGNAKVYGTINGGTSWSTLFSTGGSAAFFNGIVFSRTLPNFGFAQSDPPSGAGNPYYVQYTTNAGVNWTLINPPGVSACASAANSLFMIDGQFYGFGTSSSTASATNVRCIMTSNGGANWYNAQLVGSPSGSTQAFVPSIAFNTNKIYGVAGSSNISTSFSRTTNGGVSWFSATMPGTGTAQSFQVKYVPYTNIVYMVASSGTATRSFKSTDNGATWTALTWPSGVNGCQHMDLYYSASTRGITAYLFAVCSDGSVVKLVDVISGVNVPSNIVPVDYKLEQNYPNPFNPVTTIDYSIPKASFVTLKVYDVLGNEVMTVVNEQQVSNNYSYKVDFSKLSSGVYYYTLNAGNYTATKKLTLVK